MKTLKLLALLGLLNACTQSFTIINADCTTDSECESMHPDLDEDENLSWTDPEAPSQLPAVFLTTETPEGVLNI